MQYLKNNGRCTKCGIIASELTLVIDPNKPIKARKRDYVIAFLCEKCDK